MRSTSESVTITDVSTPLDHPSLQAVKALIDADRPVAADLMLQRLEASELDTPAGRALSIKLAGARRDPLRLIEMIDLQLQHTPARPDLRMARARACYTTGRLAEGIAGIEEIRIPPTKPQTPQVDWWHARLLIRAGRRDDAAEIAQRMEAAGGPMAAAASVQLEEIAQLEGRPEEAVRRSSQVLEDPTPPPPVHFDAAFQLARTFDRMGEHDAAFKAAVHGNAIHPHHFDGEAWERSTDELIRDFDRTGIECRTPRGPTESEAPVFIVGMPRSGTSLLEQIIAAHPNGRGMGERHDPFRMIENLDTLAKLRSGESPTREDLEREASTYLDLPRRVGVPWDPETDRFVNKALGLERILGQLCRVLPGARVIRIDRDPRDTLLSIHQSPLSVRDYPWSTRFDDLLTAHHCFQRLMHHWKQVMPIPMLEVRYETLVDAPETEIPRLLRFLGLEPDPACLRFHESDRAVITPSHDQVKRPLNRDGIDRWRAYAAHLGPLLEAFPASKAGRS